MRLCLAAHIGRTAGAAITRSALQPVRCVSRSILARVASYSRNAMTTVAARYQQYLSCVGDEALQFLNSLDARTEEDVRGLLKRKELGRRAHLARIWLDFRKKIRQEEADEEALRRINRVMLEADRV